jgi:ubiquinone/menaquinone biosynthesis C-methylase UbiE
VIALEPSPLGVETLDDPGCPAPVARATLRDIARANALLGGRQAAAWGVDRLLRHGSHGSTVTLLDVGAGSGDIARYLTMRAGRRGVALRAVGLDTHRAAAALCREAGVQPLVGSAAALPFRERSVDIVFASQFLHHFARPSVTALVRAFDRIARLGVVLCEPRRTRAAAAGIWLAALALRFQRVTRQDGVLSVRRSFTPAGLRSLLADAGVTAVVRRRPGFRIVAVWRTHDAHG